MTDPPLLPVRRAVTLGLFPLAAWLGAALLHALDRGLRSVLAAALGRGRALLADLLTCLLAVAAAGVLGVLAAVLFDPHRPTPRQALVGLALHVVCGAAGMALALLLHGMAVPRGVQAAVVLVATLVSGRLRWLPPEGPVLSTWGTGSPPGTAGAAVALGGAVGWRCCSRAARPSLAVAETPHFVTLRNRITAVGSGAVGTGRASDAAVAGSTTVPLVPAP